MTPEALLDSCSLSLPTGGWGQAPCLGLTPNPAQPAPRKCIYGFTPFFALKSLT